MKLSIVLKFSYLILRKIIKFVATRCQILRVKCTKFNFGWGSAPDPAGGAYSAPQTAWLDLRGSTSMGREGKGAKRREGSVEFHHLLLSNLTTGTTGLLVGGVLEMPGFYCIVLY